MLIPNVQAEVVAHSEHPSKSNHDSLAESFYSPDGDFMVASDVNDTMLIHWRLDAEAGSDFPSSDARIRADQLKISTGPALAIDGNTNGQARSNQKAIVELPMQIFLIDGDDDGNVDSIMVTSAITPNERLPDDVMLHLFLIEHHAIDSHGRRVDSLVREWTPSASFSISANQTTMWSSNLSKEHLEGAGVDLERGIFSNDYSIILAMIADEGSSSSLLGLNYAPLPTAWQSAGSDTIITPSFVLIFLVLITFFIVHAEYRREKALPRLRGKLYSQSGKWYLEGTLSVGDREIKPGLIEVDGTWRVTKNHRLPMRLNHGEHKFKISLRSIEDSDFVILNWPIDIDELGEWDLRMELLVEGQV